LESWKRNLYVLWVAELVAIAGFGVFSPFLPYYIQELGVRDLRAVELWSGALFASQAVAMAIFSPIWGALADRYGRKLMVERAMFGGSVVLASMGFVHNVQQLLLLRVLQGALTGTVAAATTLVASTTPRERSGYALGLLQMAVWGGASVGPLIGGLVADAWGYRAAFWVTGALLFLAGLTVWRFVEEKREPKALTDGAGEGFWDGLKAVARYRPLLPLYGIELLVRTGSSLLSPLLALFIQSLVPGSTRVASITGLISGAAAAASAVGALTIGRASDRAGYGRVLVVCLGGAALVYLPHYFVSSPWQLLALQVALGVVVSGMLASFSALLANLSPEGLHGAVYGLDASVSSMANAIGPMLGASLATSAGLRVPFLVAASAFALATGVAWLWLPKVANRQSPTSAG
jgi:DHA1 family multidrug resistance protein-like MFS transporter